MKIYFIYNLNRYSIKKKNYNLIVYKIVNNFYHSYHKNINIHFLLKTNILINLYTTKYRYKLPLLNIILKKWFFLKIWMDLINIILNYTRKVRIFNKSRYSRNRQNVRVTFYFNIYFNILIIYVVFSVFYNIALFLTYNWWFYFIFLLSFTLSYFLRTVKK